MTQLIDQALQLIRNARHCLIAAHEKPDGDAVGSVLGLTRILRANGIEATACGLVPFPDHYRFLCQDDESVPTPADLTQQPDLCVILDSGALDRVHEGVQAVAAGLPVINIDHHKANAQFGAVNVVDEQASSVGEMVCHLAATAGWTVPFEAAEALWVAIVTDTGRFTFDNTRPQTLEAAAGLVAAGARTQVLNDAVFNSMSLAAFQLRRRALNSMQLWGDGRIAAISLSEDDFADFGAGPEDAENVANLPLAIESVDISLFFYRSAQKPGTKVSMRSRLDVDVGAICREFGGGGHAKAAGCQLNASLDEARTVMRQRLERLWAGR